MKNAIAANVLAEVYTKRCQELTNSDPVQFLKDKIPAIVFDEMLDSGLIVMRRQGLVMMVGKKDGRRDTRKFPDTIMAWQFLGAIDVEGKPAGAPRWAAEHIKFNVFSGDVEWLSPATGGRSRARTMLVGDWVAHYQTVYGHDTKVLTSVEVDRWYRPAP